MLDNKFLNKAGLPRFMIYHSTSSLEIWLNTTYQQLNSSLSLQGIYEKNDSIKINNEPGLGDILL